MAIFYTYLWLREDGTPYYVGKGTGHRAYAPHSVGNAPPVERIIIQDFESEEDAFFAERFLIAYYGRKALGTGCLRNYTEGGEGTSGLVHTPETRAKIGAAKIGRKASPETRAKMSAVLIGHTRNVGNRHPPETLAKMSVAAKERERTRKRKD
jgi:hypothetical protein